MHEVPRPRRKQASVPTVQGTEEASTSPAELPRDGRVQRRGDGWEVRTHTGWTGTSGAAVVTMGILAAGMLSIALPAVTSDLIAHQLTLATLLIASLLALTPMGLTAWLARRHRALHTVHVTPAGVFHEGRLVRPIEVVLRGEPDRRIEIEAGGKILFSHFPKWGDAWPYPAVRALAETLAATLDVPLRVLLDEEAWERRPDAHQSQLKQRFDTIRQQTLQLHPKLSKLEPAEPGFLMWKHDGFQTDGLVLTATDIRRKRNVPGIPLAEVRDVAVGFDHENNPRLRVLLPHRIETICGRANSTAGIQSLLWIEQQIRDRLGTHVEKGAASDVPEELDALRMNPET